MTRARRTTRYLLEEVGADEAAPVLREYLLTTPIVKRYFEADTDASVEDLAAEAERHPVFRLIERGAVDTS